MITEKEWEWFGNAGHFCGGSSCRFHLATKVGNYLVSTVGEYYPLHSDEMQEIGLHRFYETMAFKVSGVCENPECDCGIPLINPQEVGFLASNNKRDARAAHMEMCQKWANE